MFTQLKDLLIYLYKRKYLFIFLLLILLSSNAQLILLMLISLLLLFFLYHHHYKHSTLLLLLLCLTLTFHLYTQQNNNIEAESTSNDVIVHFISTGNSDSILLEAQGLFTLIDTGDWNDHYLILTYLKSIGVKQLENLIITHYHADHLGTADTVLKAFNPKTTFVPNGSADTYNYQKFIKSVTNAAVPLEDTVIPFGDATLTFYNTKGDLENENNNSLVTLLQFGTDRLLFMADAEKEVEAQLAISNIDLLKIGHHGSYTSSTYEFLSETSPSFAVITVGKNNPYGHPHQSTMSKLELLDIPVYRTDEQGTVKFIATGNGIIPMQEAGSYVPGIK